jgi:anti-sigma28 factor (negative regulator of flagellin synthesis)
MLGDVALVQWESGATGTLPEGANGRRPTMNRVQNMSDSGVFLMEPESAEAKKWLRQLREMPDVRLARIMKIRAQIQKGTYETAAKWQVAIDRLIEELRDQ